jgi:hypothetical protein
MWKEANGISKHLPEGTWGNHEHLSLGKNRSGPRFEIGSSVVRRCVPQLTAMFSYFVVTLALHILPSESKSKSRYRVLQPLQKQLELLLTFIRSFSQFYC